MSVSEVKRLPICPKAKAQTRPAQFAPRAAGFPTTRLTPTNNLFFLRSCSNLLLLQSPNQTAQSIPAPGARTRTQRQPTSQLPLLPGELQAIHPSINQALSPRRREGEYTPEEKERKTRNARAYIPSFPPTPASTAGRRGARMGRHAAGAPAGACTASPAGVDIFAAGVHRQREQRAGGAGGVFPTRERGGSGGGGGRRGVQQW